MELTPLPRNAVASPQLSRPDWLKVPNRPIEPLWLDKNENVDPIHHALLRRVLSDVNPLFLSTYPDLGDLYRKLAKVDGVRPENLLLSAGSDGAIRYVFEAYVAPGDWVIHTAPTFAMYPVYSNMYGARALALEYEASDSGPVLPLSKVLQAIERTSPKAVFLPNPDSPTGTVFSIDDIKQILRASLVANAVVLIDEAYYPFHPTSVISLIHEFPNLIVARTFAKAWGLAGLRIGYAVGCPKVIEYLNKVRPMYEVGTFSAAFMEKMLDHESEMRESVARLNAGREHFVARMKALGLRTFTGAGNFFHVDFAEKREIVCRALENKVLFRKNFSEKSLVGFSRFTAGTKEMVEPIIQEIERVIRNEAY